MLAAALSFQDGLRVLRPACSDTLPAAVQAAIARASELEAVDGNMCALRRETSAEARAVRGDEGFLRRVRCRQGLVGGPSTSFSNARCFEMISVRDSDVVLSTTLLLRDESVGWRLVVGRDGAHTLMAGVGSTRIEVPLFVSSLPYMKLQFEFDRDVAPDSVRAEFDTVWLWGDVRHALIGASFTQTIGETTFVIDRCVMLRA
jgi:hypothetical protein